jgi:hypothetical protein
MSSEAGNDQNHPLFLRGFDAGYKQGYARGYDAAEAIAEIKAEGWFPVRSQRGFPLVICPNSVYKPTDTILTVEFYVKWYSLFTITGYDAKTTSGNVKVTEIDFDQIPFRDDEGEFSAYCDHVPNPTNVKRLAEERGWYLDELAKELIAGRWQLEIVDYDRK